MRKLIKHIKPTIALFIPQVATQIYAVLDKTMIGNITKDMSAVGFYEQAQKIIKTLLLIVTALGTVMNSRIANAFAENKKEDVKKYLMQSFNIVWLLGLPAMFGTIAISRKLVPWFYGDGYEPVIILLNITSIIFIAIGLNNITGIQYLIQARKQKIYTISVSVAAVINVILNSILIRTNGTVGATIASITAEVVILIIHLIYMRKIINVFDVFKMSIKYLISSFIMFLVVYNITNILSVGILNTMIEGIVGAIIYFGILILLKDKFLKVIINQVKIGIKGKLKIGVNNE